jgi:sarcosine oxidase subunit gamma
VSELSAWRRIGAWDGIAGPGRLGSGAQSVAEVTITPRHDLAIACVIGSEADLSALARHFADRYAVDLPSTPKAVEVNDITLLWAGPLQWLVVSRQSDLPSRLSTDLGRIAAVSDQSDARAVLRLEGASVRAALAKGCPIDLHPRAFGRGVTAITAIAGIGVQIWRDDDGDAFHLVMARSMAGSFWSWLTSASAEFGVEVLKSQDFLQKS